MSEAKKRERVSWEIVGIVLILAIFAVMVLVWLASPKGTAPPVVPTATTDVAAAWAYGHPAPIL